MVEEVREQAKAEAHSSLASETKRILGEKRRMAKDLSFQTQARPPSPSLCSGCTRPQGRADGAFIGTNTGQPNSNLRA